MGERVFAMPDLGEGLEEGRIVEWLVAEGDTVELNQPLVEVETAAAVDDQHPLAAREERLGQLERGRVHPVRIGAADHVERGAAGGGAFTGREADRGGGGAAAEPAQPRGKEAGGGRAGLRRAGVVRGAHARDLGCVGMSCAARRPRRSASESFGRRGHVIRRRVARSSVKRVRDGRRHAVASAAAALAASGSVK
ncbi:MAG TPA: biotin/lipoyl-containing protein [Actinomycetota bacterium]